MASMNDNLVVTLKAALKELNYDKLKAQLSNDEVRSGECMYKDLSRMDVLINGKSINKDLITKLYEQHNDLLHKKEELKELQENEEVFECTSTVEELEKLREEKDEDKDYRSFVKEVLKKMFEYAGAQVPNNAILEELITNCNQAGYKAALYGENRLACYFGETYGLMCNSHSTVHIDCNNHANITVTCNENVTIRNKREVEIEICQLNGSIKFTLESKDDKNIAYTDGKLSFAIPKELKNYKVGGKNLFDIIREYFQKLCEKLGFNFEEKIEYHFDALSAAGYLESVEPLINFINIQPPRNI